MKFKMFYSLTACVKAGVLSRLFARPILIVATISAFVIASQTSSLTPLFAQFHLTRPQSELARIVPFDPALAWDFGTSLAVDGDTLVVGAPNTKDAQDIQCGAVYIYVKVGGSWNFQSKLPQPDPFTSAQFGSSVAIEGDTLLVGAENDRSSSTGQGSAYIFQRNGSTWSAHHKLVPSNGREGFGFGSSVAIEANTVAVGAFRGEVAGVTTPGAAYVFTDTGPSWVETARLADIEGNQFGARISLSGDTLVVGSPLGRFASVYVRDGNAWLLQAKLRAADTTGMDWFASDVAIEGDTLVIGARDNIAAVGNLLRCGAAYIFARTTGVWTQQQKLAGEPCSDLGDFGASVGISGNRLIVGDSRITVNGRSAQGAAYVYVKNGPTWSLQNKLTASDGQVADFLGTDVAIQDASFFVGAPGVDLGQNQGTNDGAVYFFIQSPLPPDLRPALDTGTSNSDNITNIQDLVFDINGATPGATVELLFDGTVVDSEIATQTTVVVTHTPSANSTHQYTSRQIVNGETSSLSETVPVNVDTTPPVFRIEQGPTQADPTTFSTIYFRLFYLEPVVGFATTDISFEGTTANLSNVIITHTNSPVSDTIRIDNVISDGHVVRASLPAGSVADLAGNPSIATESPDNMVTIDNVRPTLTINQSVGQADPTSSLPLRYTAVFSEPVTGFNAGDVLVTSTGNITGLIRNVSGSGATYEITVSNLLLNGSSVRISSGINVAQDAFGNFNLESTSTDNFVTLDNVGPTVSVAPAPGQANPTPVGNVNFRVVFNESVSGFDASDVSLSGSTANITNAAVVVTGSGTTYNISVSNVVSDRRFVRANVTAGAVSDALGNPSTASTGNASITVDNVAATVAIDQAIGQVDPAIAQPVNFMVIFSEPVTGLTASDISLAASTANVTVARISITGGGDTWNVAVSNVISSGEVRASVIAAAATDPLGNLSAASESTDNTITLEIPAVADITGRISNLSGRGLALVRVEIVLLNGERIYTQTNPFGYYRVIGVPTGQIMITATRKNSSPASTTFYLLGSAPNTNFAFL